MNSLRRHSRHSLLRGTGRLVALMIVASALPNAPVMVQGADDPISAVHTFADNLIEHARDHYGPKQTPLFVSQLDIQTRTLLPATSKLYISDQRGGAGPTTNNLQFDTCLLRLLYALSQVTGDLKCAAANLVFIAINRRLH